MNNNYANILPMVRALVLFVGGTFVLTGAHAEECGRATLRDIVSDGFLERDSTAWEALTAIYDHLKDAGVAVEDKSLTCLTIADFGDGDSKLGVRITFAGEAPSREYMVPVSRQLDCESLAMLTEHFERFDFIWAGGPHADRVVTESATEAFFYKGCDC